MTNETRVCRICGADLDRWEPPDVGACAPDICYYCNMDRNDFAKAILTGWDANPRIWPSSDAKFAHAVVKSAEFMLVESRKPRGES